LDISTIPSGNDYGVRVLANDGFTDSDPTLGTSPVTSSGLGFTILNHAPNTPIFTSPLVGSTVSRLLKAEWLEAIPVDVDGDAVFYTLGLTMDSSVSSPAYQNVGVLNEGTTSTIIDVSGMPDGNNFQLSIVATDARGAVGATNYSGNFSVVNITTLTDFERLDSTLYASGSDGILYRANETIWQVDNDFSYQPQQAPYLAFISGNPTATIQNGALNIKSPAGSTFILRVAPPEGN
jgi:hypothetical protein